MDRLTRRMTYEDRFARRWWCKKAARNYIRHAKRANRRTMRQRLKKVEVEYGAQRKEAYPFAKLENKGGADMG